MGVNNIENANKFATITLPISQTQSSFDLSKLIKKYTFYWPIFLLSILIFIISAYLYIKFTKPVYPVNATLEFKNVSTQGGYGSVDKNSLQGLDQISKPVDFKNEIEVLKSKKVMLQVVNDLNLWINYSKKDGLSTADLYNSSPVNFQFIKMPERFDPKGIQLDIIVKDGDTFIIKDKDGKQTEFKFGQYIQSNFGLWKLDRKPSIGSYLGSNIKIAVADPSAVADGYAAGIKSTIDDKDVPFVILSVSDVLPNRGEDVLNGVIKAYLKSAIDEKNKKTEATIRFISKRIDSISRDLRGDESQLESYASSQGLTDINSQSQTYVQDKQANEKALDDINIQIRIINNVENYLNSPQNSERQPSTQGLTDQGLNTMLDKLSELQLNKQHLLATNPPSNPVFEPINNEIRSLQEKIREKVRTNKEALLLTKSQLESYGSRSTGQIKNVPGQQMKYSGMKRDKDVEEGLYTFLLEQREQLSLKYASTVSDAQVVDDAHAGSPSWPKPGLFYMAALMLGIFVPVVIIYTMDIFDFNKITNPKQIESAIDIPILGELSFQKSNTPLVISQGKENNAIGEQFRLIRTNLSYLYNNRDISNLAIGKVTLFTSSTAGEGKSFISSNLALTLAYSAKKTIVLEMDLRKPKIAAMFDLPSERLGISDFLGGEKISIEELIQHTSIPGLDIISCGTISINPSELLERDELGYLLTELRKIYDHILIDSPPIHLVTDALIIARYADVSLYVIRQGYTQKEELDFIKAANLDTRLPNLNIIFNGIKRVKYGYGYNYDSGYYVVN
jgi:tyrosine-protein kinase Etk/Wzc